MSARYNTKLIARNVVAWSSSFTIAHVLTANARPKNSIQKGEIMVGSMVLGWMVGDEASKFTDKLVDQIFDIFESETPVTEPLIRSVQ